MIIEHSGSAGFSNRHYKKVYKLYKKVTEDVMSNKRVPNNYRQLVKRYFQMIKPR